MADTWMTLGACATAADPDDWFPEHGDGRADRSPTAQAALRTCAGCFVRTQCLAYALDNDIRYGIWGGQTEQQRAIFVGRARRGGDAA